MKFRRWEAGQPAYTVNTMLVCSHAIDIPITVTVTVTDPCEQSQQTFVYFTHKSAESVNWKHSWTVQIFTNSAPNSKSKKKPSCR